MSLIVDVRKIEDVQKLLSVVAALNPYVSFADVPAALGRFSGGPFGYKVFPRNPPAPAFLWMDTGDQVIVAAAGILTAQDGLAVFASSLQPLITEGTWRANESVLRAGRALFGHLGDRFAIGPRSWVLVGHSYGGSALCATAGLLSNAGVIADLQLLTFGSPRPGDSSLRDLLSRFTVRRVMGSDDPVVRFPPHLDEAPALCLAIGFGSTLQWSRYVQPQGGLVLWPDGTQQTRQLPTQLLPVTDVSLLGWALSDRGFFATGHKVAEYQHRVGEAVVIAAAAPPSPLIGSGPEPTRELSTLDFSAVAGGAAVAVSPLGGSEMSQGYIPPQYRAVAFKAMPNDYRVRWMGGVVLSGLNRSNARSLARGINGWLRRMQGGKSADHTQFNASLAAYWLVCVSSSLGFNPPLNVT